MTCLTSTKLAAEGVIIIKIIDLTNYIYPDMPVFPGTEPPTFVQANTLEKDGFAEASITMSSHTGTHIDAPAHMLPHGTTLDDFPIENFMGKAVLLDFSDRWNIAASTARPENNLGNVGASIARPENDPQNVGASTARPKKNIKQIEIKDLLQFEELLADSPEFIILRTDWSKYWRSPQYFENYPSLTDAAARWICQFNIKAVGIDAISIDAMDSTEFAVHKIFMQSNILIVENLTNLDLLEEKKFLFSVMPIKTKDADGAPARAVAVIGCHSL
jgi:kynurenine formamidase